MSHGPSPRHRDLDVDLVSVQNTTRTSTSTPLESVSLTMLSTNSPSTTTTAMESAVNRVMDTTKSSTRTRLSYKVERVSRRKPKHSVLVPTQILPHPPKIQPMLRFLYQLLNPSLIQTTARPTLSRSRRMAF